MVRKKKENVKHVTARISEDIVEKLDNIADELKIDRTTVIISACEEYIKKINYLKDSGKDIRIVGVSEPMEEYKTEIEELKERMRVLEDIVDKNLQVNLFFKNEPEKAVRLINS